MTTSSTLTGSTSGSTTRTATRLLLAAVLVVLSATVLVPLPSAQASAQLLASVNAERARAGVAPLARAADMDLVAQAWSEQLARSGRLAHNPNYTSQVGNWTAIAENVGMGQSEPVVHRALMDSPGHRTNILNPTYTEVGIGVASGHGSVWVTQVFRRPARATTPAMSHAAATAYVGAIYRDLLGRGPDPAGAQQWATSFVAGTPPQAVTNAITTSPEFRTKLIVASYRQYLGRGPDPVGQQTWLDAMYRGWTMQGMEAGFVSSEEFYQRAGGTDGGWVRALYRTVLGRAAAQSEVDGWVAAVRGGRTRYDVAVGFLLSTEDLGALVDGYYHQLLGRGIDPTGQQHWVRAIQSGTRIEHIIGGIVASGEYFART